MTDLKPLEPRFDLYVFADYAGEKFTHDTVFDVESNPKWLCFAHSVLESEIAELTEAELNKRYPQSWVSRGGGLVSGRSYQHISQVEHYPRNIIIQELYDEYSGLGGDLQSAYRSRDNAIELIELLEATFEAYPYA